jgi:hypothetical protein
MAAQCVFKCDAGAGPRLALHLWGSRSLLAL